MGRVLVDHSPQPDDCLVIITSFDRQPRIVIEYRHVVWLQRQGTLQRNFCIIQTTLFDPEISETRERVNEVGMRNQEFFQKLAREIEIACGSMGIAAKIIDVFYRWIKRCR